ncbi:ribosome small subunit-dependent GTPase A [Lacibacterium aquatile]|uniref:Small ribosomal subunit biogenesis GTPase RsgA n=1 Tax=Lacibacterium aquatile TaxID=1168082 RepID=A0ABW5DXE9_9PROT
MSSEPVFPLATLGWDADFAQAFAVLPGAAQLVPARLSVEHRQHYEALTEQGPIEAILPGTFRRTLNGLGEHAAVGDWVAVEIKPQGPAAIAALLPRRGAFVRKVAGERAERQVVAANIDLALLTIALDQDFNERRLERYLAAARGGGAAAVVLLTKLDLCPDPSPIIAAARSVVGEEVPVIACSSRSGAGTEALTALLNPGKTLVLLGSSGIGKSSMVNFLMDFERMAVSGLDSIGKGRHTTTRRELILLPSGAILIDTPGMRELHLWEEESSLADAFGDLDELATECRYNNCGHTSEPGCAVRAAVEAEEIDPARVAAWQKLLGEQAASALRAQGREKHSDMKRRQEVKTIHRALRSRLKEKGR